MAQIPMLDKQQANADCTLRLPGGWCRISQIPREFEDFAKSPCFETLA